MIAETQVTVVNLPVLAAMAGGLLLLLVGLVLAVRYKRRAQVDSQI